MEEAVMPDDFTNTKLIDQQFPSRDEPDEPDEKVDL